MIVLERRKKTDGARVAVSLLVAFVKPEPSLDVAVIGAGPAGAVAARVLAQAGRSVALIDECRRARRIAAAELLPLSAVPLLEELEILALVERGPHIAAIPDGWHLDRARFEADLVHLAVHAGASLVNGRASHFDLSSSGWNIRIDDADAADAVAARFVVDATGRRAVVATRFGARRISMSKRWALAAVIEDNRNDDDRHLLGERTPDGVLVSAPLSGRRRAIALHTTEEIAREILRKPIELNRRVRNSTLVGPVIHPRARIGAPVLLETGASRLDRCVGHRWLAVGDAARSFDPLDGPEGITRALESAFLAALAIDEAMDDRPAALDAYAQAAA